MNVTMILPYEGRNIMGGILAYVSNFGTLMELAGHTCQFYCLDKGKGAFKGVGEKQLIEIAHQPYCFIGHIHDNSQTGRYKELNLGLLKSGAALVSQDVRIFSEDVFTKLRGKYICTGRGLYRYMIANNKSCVYIPLPYARKVQGKIKKPVQHDNSGICATRVGNEKNIGLIAEINQKSNGTNIYISGVRDMRYVNFRLRKQYPHWDDFYLQAYPYGSFQDVYRGYAYAVDFSFISATDAGRAQFCFMEAMEMGLPLVIHRDWEGGGKDEMKDRVNCIAVRNAEEFLNREKEILKADFSEEYEKLLIYHSRGIAHKFMEVFG